ncbi:alpha/beta hydrolase [Mycolicibacterium fortuitum]|uniref:alpha/beta hydrolase n=1 Tax=Mycolicibacterium fortuitum TaxID=1766 RepID=UPI0007EC157A|nr:alpha/beta hydrolase [Mycolicibacterium fortuitum]OBB39488.1 esterase [Mycolicibacterium fortuitum]OBB43019.1 esterase [Mycolicibacterium fortuitum]OBB52222.1 esterase [Mycolicibacterium fortuitum]OBF79460.1 esterase [Mycolicibacterium fortuitum]OBG10256.1 esterase [Mycolicibacterium fortuitum]
MTAPSKVSRLHHAGISPARPYRGRRFPVSDGAPVEVVEDGPSLAGRLASLAATLTIKPTLAIGSHVPHLPWPFGLVNFAARLIRPVPGTIKATIALPNCTAQLVRADGVLPADGKRSVILYLHGGAFLACGANTHSGIVTALSGYADSPVLVVDYRMVPKHSVGTAIDDCYDAYRWLRLTGYQPDQIVLAGDSAGGYLSLALAERLVDEGEMPAALVTMSPLFEIDNESRANHPNIHTDAMFPAKAFDALVELVERAAARKGEDVYEPLDHIEPGLPRTLIHASGSEALLSDARKAAHMLAAAGVPVELRIWPGQMHVFQLASPMVAEAKRSLRQIGEYIREATW